MRSRVARHVLLLGVAALLAASWAAGVARNVSSIHAWRAWLPAVDPVAIEDLDRRCDEARGIYAAGDLARTAELLASVWWSASAGDLRRSRCRQAAPELAASLERLGRKEDAEYVWQRTVLLNPEARDWIMHFAGLAVGEAELKRGRWQLAQSSCVVAYDSAFSVPPAVAARYEERAFAGLQAVAAHVSARRVLDAAAMEARAGSYSSPDSPGWHVLLGLLYERQGAPAAAAEAYEAAIRLAPGANSPKQRAERLRSGR